MYDRFSGGRERALRVLERSLAEPGTASSAEVVYVAEADGAIVGAMAAFPVEEAPPRSAPFCAWPCAAPLPRAGRWPCTSTGRGDVERPDPPAAAFYVDALAIEPGQRRRGVARALLAQAERDARGLGLPAVALDTTIANVPARALYASEGYDEVAYSPPGRGLPGFVGLVKPLG